MKICIILSCSRIAKPKFYNLQEVGLARELLKYRFSTDIYIYSREVKCISQIDVIQEGNSQVRLFYYPAVEMPGRQVLSWRLLKHMNSHMEEYSIIQVHDNSLLQNVLILFLAKKKRKICVLCQGMYEDFKGVYKRILQKLYDILFTGYFLNNCGAVICKTRRALEYLRYKGLKEGVKVSVLNIGLDEGVLVSREKEPAEVFDNLPDSIDVLYVGRIEKRRNAMFMMDLFKRLLERDNNLSIVMIGDGAEYEKCVQKAREYQIGAKINFVKQFIPLFLPEF